MSAERSLKPGAGAALGRLAWRLGLAVLLAYGAVQLLVRTDFFRTRVEAELSRLAGMEMRVGRVRTTPSLNLKLRDVISVSEAEGIAARTVRVRWRLFRPRDVSWLESLRVEGLAVTFAPDAAGGVKPAILGRLSRLLMESAGVPAAAAARPAAQEAEAVTRPLAAGVRGPVEVRWASLRWQDAAGNLLASASGLELAWLSMETPNGRVVSHLECNVAEVRVEPGRRIAGLHVELLQADGRQFLVALDAQDWGGGLAPAVAPGPEVRALLDGMDVPVAAPP